MKQFEKFITGFSLLKFDPFLFEKKFSYGIGPRSAALTNPAALYDFCIGLSLFTPVEI